MKKNDFFKKMKFFEKIKKKLTPHGPLTRLGQPPLVPSLNPDNPPWSPHPPIMTPLGPLTHP